jgi:hypothetical protein
MKSHDRLSVISILIAVVAGGCGSSREVEVAGDAKASGQTAVAGPVTIQFWEVAGEGDDAPTEPVKSITIEKLGPFTAKVDVEGDKIRVLAIADSDKSGSCTEGEAWAEAQATIKDDDTIDRVTLALAVAACPSAPAPK